MELGNDHLLDTLVNMFTRDSLHDKVTSSLEDHLEALRGLVAIPSVSSDPNAQEKMRLSAEYTADLFSSLGLQTQILQAPIEADTLGQPAVIAVNEHQAGRPTVLLYAHHDVQPTGDVSRWDTPPFEMTVVGDRIYGRGTSDDGAGVLVHYGALKALGNDLDLNIAVFIEGEEEIGSPSFTNFLKQNRDLLEADVIVVADSGNWTVDVPALTTSLRGVASIEFTVKVLDTAVHSGFYGGPVLDAVTIASRLISSLHNEDGEVAISGLGGSSTSDVDWDERVFKENVGAVEGLQLAGKGDLAARIWTKPAINVIGLDATRTKDAANAIIPECRVRLSLRVVPGEDPYESAQNVVDHLHAQVPFGASLETSILETGPSYEADLTKPVVTKLREALREAWNTEPVAIGQGGSIPFISQFEEFFPDATVLVTGVEDPDTAAHAENESQSIKVLQNATVAQALLLADLAGSLEPPLGEDKS